MQSSVPPQHIEKIKELRFFFSHWDILNDRTNLKMYLKH